MKKIFLVIAILPLLYSCKHKETIMLDRIEVQDLINTYAHYADNREAQKQAELFTENAVVKVFNGKETQPVQVLTGRTELAEGFQGLTQYDVTTHFNGQSLLDVSDNTASGESYCLAHHVKTDQDGKATLLVMAIRYQDKFVKQDSKWLFSERDLFIDWMENRELK